MKLPRSRARTAPFANLLAIGRVLEDARVGVTVADENPTSRCKRNIGGSAESGERRFRQSTHVDLKQPLALRTKLDDCRTSRVDRPNISLRVEPDRVRNPVQSFTKRMQDPAFLANPYDWIGLVAALNEPRYTGFRVTRQPRNHAKLLALQPKTLRQARQRRRITRALRFRSAIAVQAGCGWRQWRPHGHFVLPYGGSCQ
jgi:hypothetical protein